ncbi:MAG: putative 2-aminoethylphosphonate ABC transporter ATP-binding protein [Magnetovibrio sp.]|nr:putative 2-aminoethylphosphonate ABC transporter ATP-binding protein [Magnetovibrio sp.]
MNKITADETVTTPYLEINNLTKKFGEFVALDDVSLTVKDGEFVCFLGPSGCGKTTLLRAIAGLDFQTSGQIVQGGKDISHLPPVSRDFGIVFQSYALFPNLTAKQNIAYGLSVRKMGRDKVNQRVQDLLDTVGLSDSGPKYPSALSGGQQQRIALARALANEPNMLLLDEPLSALDAKVRVNLRHEMKELQRKLGITTIMVTHDQEEAMAMADKIVVMNHGVIEQVGTPQEIYGNPATAYVADFIGEMNFLEGVFEDGNQVRMGDCALMVDGQAGGFELGSTVTACIRPEDVMVRGVSEKTENYIDAEVVDVEFLGSFCRAELACRRDGRDIRLTADFSINLMRDMSLGRGERLAIALPKEHLQLFPGSADLDT